jgi:bisphosphoglycerate-independent phosphoglycerate mutase (AlkP superfamily)
MTETEKYAHVTFFFNGGVERQFDGEERHMIPSPKVATYDKDPKMSVFDVAKRVAEVLRAGEHEFVMCNFAPPDMVCPNRQSDFPWLMINCLSGWAYWYLRGCCRSGDCYR